MSTAPTPLQRRRAPAHLKPALTALAVFLLAAILIALLVDRVSNTGNPAGTGSGVAATQGRSLAPFTGVDLAGQNNVVVQVGPRQSVVVHADSNLLGRVTTRVRSGSLVIRNTPGSLNARAPMFVAVSLPSLDTLTLHGAGNISVTGVNSGRLTIAIPGSGTIHAAGTTRRLEVSVVGEGTALLGQLTARDAKAAISGHGSIMLTAIHSLNANVSGSGAILYNGNPPHVTQAVTGTGTITSAGTSAVAP